MFIRAQFTGEEFKNLLKFRMISFTRRCPQLFFKATEQRSQALMIKDIDFIGVKEIIHGESLSVGYPNNALQSHIFQRNRLNLKLQFKVLVGFLNANNDLDPNQLDLIANVDAAIDLKVQNGKDILTFEVLGTDLDSLLSLIGVGKQEISNLLSAGQVKLDLIKQIDDLRQQISGSIIVRHADIGFNKALDIVEVGIEVINDNEEPSFDAVSFWSQFYANQFDSVLAGSQWAMFFDQRIGTSIIGTQLPMAIDEFKRFHRDGGVNVSWDGGFPGYRISVKGELMDACRCLWGLIDVDIRLSIDVKFSVVNDRLHIDIWVDYEVIDEAEPLCCLLTAVVLFPLVGLEYALTDHSMARISWYGYLIGLFLYPHTVILFLAALAKMGSAKIQGVQICQKDPADDKHFTCEFPLPVFTESASCLGTSISLTTTTLSGRSDGLVLGGNIDMPAIIKPQVKIDVSDLKYSVSYGCSSSPDDGEHYSTMIQVSRASGNYDFRLCDVTVLGPLERKVRIKIETKNCPYAAWVKLSIAPWDYDGKPLKVILTTSQGTHFVTIPAAEVIPEKERQKAVLEATLKRVNNCYAKSKRWDIKWLIDPAPYENIAQAKQLWVVTGVASKDISKVEIFDAEGMLLATIDVNQTKAFRIAIINPTKVMTIVQETDHDIGEHDLLMDSEIHAVQTLVGVEHEITLDRTILAADILQAENQRKAIIHQADRLKLFDISAFGELIPSGELDAHNLLWIGRRGMELYAQNTDGRLFSLDLRRQEFPRWQESSGSQIPRIAAKSSCCNKNIEVLRGMPAASEESKLQQEPNIGAVLKAQSFDHFLQRGSIVPSEGLAERHVQGAFQITQESGALLVSAVDRKLANVAAASLNSALPDIPTHIGSGMFLALSRDRHSIQLLRTLTRSQL